VISASISAVVAVGSVGIGALREAAADRQRQEREDRHRREDEDETERLEEAIRLVRVYADVRAEIDVAAIDRVVLDQARAFRDAAADRPGAPDIGQAVDFLHRIRHEELARLRDVCRRDLGLPDA